jgi:hypothetical protein
MHVRALWTSGVDGCSLPLRPLRRRGARAVTQSREQTSVHRHTLKLSSADRVNGCVKHRFIL